jgi:hypothetical protein
MTWSPPDFDGGSPVIDYRIMSDGAFGGAFTLLAENILETSYIDTTV